MLCLRTLGGLSLENEGKPASGAAGQRAPLALLAFIASTGETGASRDRIASLFWPERDAERAHGSLKQALYSLRRDAGSQTLLLGTSALSLNHDVIRCDAVEFVRATERKDFEAAVALYRGDFLDGVYITGNGEFDRWVQSERSRLSDHYTRALETLAKSASEKGEHDAAVQWWRKLATVDRLSGRVARHYMLALAAVGDCEGAIRFAELHERIVAAELDAKPDPEISKLLMDLRSGRGAPLSRIVPDDRPLGEKDPVIEVSPAAAAPATAIIPPGKSLRTSRFARGGAVAILLVGMGLPAALAHRPAVARDGSRTVIALLPCEDASSDSATLATGDRWSEEIIRKLVRVGGLKPKSWASVQRYKGTKLDPREIRAELNASTLIRCTVEETGKSTHLNVELIQAPDDQVIWQNEYDQLPGPVGINAAQTAAVIDIAHALGSPVSSTGAATVSRPLTRDSTALRLYRIGRYYLMRMDESSDTSIYYFRQAIAHDPTFADAYASLAEAKILLGEGGSMPAREFYPEAGALLRKAISLDPGISRARSWLGTYLLEYTLDWTGAEAEHRTAIQLDPSSTEAHVWYSYHLLTTGRLDAAVAEAQLAVDLDPADKLSRGHLVRALVFAGQDDRALREIEQGTALNPKWYVFYMHKALILIRRGQLDSARAVIQKHLDPGDPLNGWLYAMAGRPDVERHVLDSLRALNEARPVDPVVMASLEIGLGHKDTAFELLERGFAERSTLLFLFLGPNPAFDAVRNDYRFKALRRRAGYTD